MLLKHKFIVLTYEATRAPCIIRVDRITHIKEMPGGHTQLTCNDGRVCMVHEPVEEVRLLVANKREGEIT